MPRLVFFLSTWSEWMQLLELERGLMTLVIYGMVQAKDRGNVAFDTITELHDVSVLELLPCYWRY